MVPPLARHHPRPASRLGSGRGSIEPANGDHHRNCGSLIDGTGAEPQGRTIILVEGGRIQAVGPALDVPASARIIDLSDMTVLPGFIDLHSHPNYPAMTDAGFELAFVQASAVDFVLLGARNAKLALMTDYTSARELGAFGFADVALRDAIDAGWVPGPRLQVAAYVLSITGGHCDNNGFLPGLFGAGPGTEQSIANGPQEVRAAIRYQVKYGADLIKICATGGVMWFGDSVGAQQFNASELEAAYRVPTNWSAGWLRTLTGWKGSRLPFVQVSTRSSMARSSTARRRA